MKLGLPMVFKAINMETGQELGVDSLQFNLHECQFCNQPIEVDPDVNNCPFCNRSSFERITNEYSLVFWGYLSSEKTKIVQQTGFTDKAGKDVYFGDVLALNLKHLGKTQYSIVNLTNDFGFGLNRIAPIWWPSGNSSVHPFDHFHIVGNAYEPQSKWLERARAIWPDAQLPEGGI
jgi:hypothetical protein